MSKTYEIDILVLHLIWFVWTRDKINFYVFWPIL